MKSAPLWWWPWQQRTVESDCVRIPSSSPEDTSWVWWIWTAGGWDQLASGNTAKQMDKEKAWIKAWISSHSCVESQEEMAGKTRKQKFPGNVVISILW